MANKSRNNKASVIDILLREYHADPTVFRKFLPELAQELDLKYPCQRTHRSPFGLTENERVYRQQELDGILGCQRQGQFSSQEVLKALEHCAVLIEDDNLPINIDHETLLHLVKAAIGKSPNSVKSRTTIAITENCSEKTVNHISLMRGVVLDLSADMRLLSITIIPTKVRERCKALSFVGISLLSVGRP